MSWTVYQITSVYWTPLRNPRRPFASKPEVTGQDRHRSSGDPRERAGPGAPDPPGYSSDGLGVHAHQANVEHTRLPLNITCLSPLVGFGSVGNGAQHPGPQSRLPGCERRWPPYEPCRRPGSWVRHPVRAAEPRRRRFRGSFKRSSGKGPESRSSPSSSRSQRCLSSRHRPPGVEIWGGPLWANVRARQRCPWLLPLPLGPQRPTRHRRPRTGQRP